MRSASFACGADRTQVNRINHKGSFADQGFALTALKETQFTLRWAIARELSTPRCCRKYPYTHAVA